MIGVLNTQTLNCTAHIMKDVPGTLVSVEIADINFGNYYKD